MKRVLTALVLIPLVLLAVFKAPNWLFTLLVGVVALLALKEYLDLVEAYGVKPIRWLTAVVVACEFAFIVWFSLTNASIAAWIPFVTIALLAILFLAPFFFLIAAMRQAELSKAFPSAAMSFFAFVYISTPMACVAVLQAVGWYPLIFTFFAVWAGDIVAMYTGKAIGRYKMSPRVSPNKTWEGAIGSIVGSVVACWLLTHYAVRIDHLLYKESLPVHMSAFITGSDMSGRLVGLPRAMMVILAAVLLNIAAQLGDLVESLIKRGANVKDSGTMLPGHGGILDRIDALLFAAPVALILFVLLR